MLWRHDQPVQDAAPSVREHVRLPRPGSWSPGPHPQDQSEHLNRTSEHLTSRKLSLVRTLYERATTITDPEDRALEEKHLQDALKTCQYPQRSMDKGAKQAKKKETEQTRKKKPTPYIGGVTERMQRTMRKYNIHTPVKPLAKLRQILVNPKGRIEENKCNVVYEIRCQSCSETSGRRGGEKDKREQRKKRCTRKSTNQP